MKQKSIQVATYARAQYVGVYSIRADEIRLSSAEGDTDVNFVGNVCIIKHDAARLGEMDYDMVIGTEQFFKENAGIIDPCYEFPRDKSEYEFDRIGDRLMITFERNVEITIE